MLSRTGSQLRESVKKQVRKIYLAKCKDLGVAPSKPREDRFMEIFERNCSGATFDMSDQGLGPNTSVAIYHFLAHNTRYTSLVLSGNMIQGPGASALAQLLLVNTTITHLDLRSNDIDTEGGIALFQALETNQTLTSLDLSGAHGVNRNHIGGKCADAIASVISSNHVLHRLYLSENGLGCEGILRIAVGLGYCGGRGTSLYNSLHNNRATVSLSVLELGQNSLGWDGCTGLCRALAGSALEQLLIPGNNIGDSGVTAVAELVATKPPAISVLDLSSNNITPKGVRMVAEALKIGGVVSCLNLSNNPLGQAGMRALAEAINHNDHLTSLDLSQTQMDGLGCTELAESIRRNFALTKLNLHNNKIGDEGAAALAEALEFDHKLLFLDVGLNRIGDAGGCALAGILHNNTTLRHLELKNNILQDAAAGQLSRALQGNKTILYLGVQINDFEYKFLNAIENRITDNQRRYKAEALIRFQREINSLRVDEDRLHRLEQELRDVTEEQRVKELEAQDKLKDMENIEEENRHKVFAINEVLQETSKSIQRSETKHVAVTKEISRFKAEKELKVRNLVAKLHKEKDFNQRLERKLAIAKQDFVMMREKQKQEIERLSEVLRREVADKRQAEMEAEQVRKGKRPSSTTTMTGTIVHTQSSKSTNSNNNNTSNMAHVGSISKGSSSSSLRSKESSYSLLSSSTHPSFSSAIT